MIEREIKLAAEVGMALPDLANAVPGLTVGPKSVVQLDAVYYDTPTLALARWGVTLRSRSGEAGPVWTLKLPMTKIDSALSRHELMFDEPIGPVPMAVRQAVRAYTRSEVLGPVVRLQTERTQFTVELDGQPLAKVCDDTVVADGAAKPVNVFREVEVELAADTSAPEAIDAVVARLCRAGCHDDERPMPKALRALGPRASDPPDAVAPKVGKRATVVRLVRHCLAKSVSQLIDQHARVCVCDDPEALHQFRVAARRLRSDLRTFAPLLDRGWTTWLRDELGWLGSEVGSGRDADVLAARLRSQLRRLPAKDAKAVGGLLERLAETKTSASEHVLATLADERYVVLLDALVDAARQPRFAAGDSAGDRRARPIVAALARKPWRRLRRAVDDLRPDAPDEAIHAIRILAKRARYAADAVVPLYGKPARRFAEALADVQEVLGSYQDTTVAEAWLREAAKAVPSTRLVAGELIAFERDDRMLLHAEFSKVWKKSSRRNLRKWLG
ncbi:MAG: CYTH and CHAD domain-containing protein [Ilumatobacteraceae bacterium]